MDQLGIRGLKTRVGRECSISRRRARLYSGGIHVGGVRGENLEFEFDFGKKIEFKFEFEFAGLVTSQPKHFVSYFDYKFISETSVEKDIQRLFNNCFVYQVYLQKTILLQFNVKNVKLINHFFRKGILMTVDHVTEIFLYIIIHNGTYCYLQKEHLFRTLARGRIVCRY